MKQLEFKDWAHATQIVVGVQDGHVMLGVEGNPQKRDAHWLVYQADPETIRYIARTMMEGADIIEGKLADTGQYDDSAEGFHEHY